MYHNVHYTYIYIYINLARGTSQVPTSKTASTPPPSHRMHPQTKAGRGSKTAVEAGASSFFP